MNDTTANELRDSIDKLRRLMEKQLQQREAVLTQWKKANPQLTKKCSVTAKVLVGVHQQMLDEIIHATENPDEYLNTFTMGEFVDKYGPRLAHLTSMVQLFTQLGN